MTTRINSDLANTQLNEDEINVSGPIEDGILVIKTNATRLPEDAPYKIFDIRDSNGVVLKQVKAKAFEDILFSND